MQTESREFSRVVAEARTIADETGQPLSSVHLLLGLFTVSNPAELVLRSRRADEDLLLSLVQDLVRDAPEVFQSLIDRAREIAQGTAATDARALHILLAITRQKGCAAYELLMRAGIAPHDLAREVLSYAVGPLPRRFIARDADTEDPAEPRPTSAPPRAPVSSAPPRPISHPPVSRPPLSAPAPAPSAPPPRPTSRVSTLESQPPPDPQRASRIVAMKRMAEGLGEQPAPFALSPEEFPYLASLGRNLTELAAAGKMDPVIGRDREIDEALDVLGKRRSNNPVLVGEPGVGKTAVVEGVAQRLAAAAGDAASRKILVEMDVAGLIAGTQLRGSLSEKLNGIKDEVRRAGGRIIVFIDEIHTLVGAGQTGEGAQDAANDLKAALARGEFPCIGATTFSEFQRYFAQDAALERRFVPIRIDEPKVPDAISVLRGVAPRYAQHHGVSFTDDVIGAAVTLSSRFIRDRCLPDKAIAVLDHVGSRVRREGRTEVTRDDVARVVARMAGVPEDRVLVNDADRILRLEEELGRRVIGHPEVVARVAHAVRRNFGGFSGQRPMASFIFLGPTGVGKTELARSLAEVVFGGPESLIRVDMSEYSEGHAVAKLVGAPPGYVGYSEGGQLTEAVRRKPASVVLLDEIEKAHQDSQELILQVLDEGHLTDGRGRRVDFTSTIVVLTSNLGADALVARVERPMGFGTPLAVSDSKVTTERAARALSAAREAFPPELWNRIEERLVFSPLRQEDLRRIALLLAARSSARLLEDKRIRYELDGSAVEHLLANGGHDPTLGARPLKQTLSRLVEGPLADRILRGDIQAGDRVRVVERRGKLEFEQLTVLDPQMARA
jgi:ATP-dependent Clp protease ATP-binding subunit ClpC